MAEKTSLLIYRSLTYQALSRLADTAFDLRVGKIPQIDPCKLAKMNRMFGSDEYNDVLSVDENSGNNALNAINTKDSSVNVLLDMIQAIELGIVHELARVIESGDVEFEDGKIIEAQREMVLA